MKRIEWKIEIEWRTIFEKRKRSFEKGISRLKVTMFFVKYSMRFGEDSKIADTWLRYIGSSK